VGLSSSITWLLPHLVTVFHIHPGDNPSLKMLHNIDISFRDHLTRGVHNLGDRSERGPREEDQRRDAQAVKAQPQVTVVWLLLQLKRLTLSVIAPPEPWCRDLQSPEGDESRLLLLTTAIVVIVVVVVVVVRNKAGHGH